MENTSTQTSEVYMNLTVINSTLDLLLNNFLGIEAVAHLAVTVFNATLSNQSYASVVASSSTSAATDNIQLTNNTSVKRLEQDAVNNAFQTKAKNDMIHTLVVVFGFKKKQKRC